MFMPNDFGNGGGAPQQGSGGPFDLQAQLAQLPPQIRAQVMARMGMPGQGGMQANTPDQGQNQMFNGMQAITPDQGMNQIRGQRQGPPGPPQPMPAPGSGPIAGRSQMGPVTGTPTGRPMGMGGPMPGAMERGMGAGQADFSKGPQVGMGQAPVPDGGNVLTSMPAPVPNGNARPFRPQMSATDRAAAIAADRQMVGGAPPNVGKPQTPGMTDPPQIEPTVTGTATDVKPPVVGKPGPMPPTPSPQQDPLQKPKPKPKPTLGRNYGPK